MQTVDSAIPVPYDQRAEFNISRYASALFSSFFCKLLCRVLRGIVDKQYRVPETCGRKLFVLPSLEEIIFYGDTSSNFGRSKNNTVIFREALLSEKQGHCTTCNYLFVLLFFLLLMDRARSNEVAVTIVLYGYNYVEQFWKVKK